MHTILKAFDVALCPGSPEGLCKEKSIQSLAGYRIVLGKLTVNYLSNLESAHNLIGPVVLASYAS